MIEIQKLRNLTGLLVILVMIGCSSQESNQSIAAEEPPIEEAKQTEVNASNPIDDMDMNDEMLFEIIQSIPTPMEMSLLLKKNGAQFSEELLNSTDNKKNYMTAYKKAINLGVYGADLAYSHIYSEKAAAITYLGTVKEVAEDLNIGQFFDFQTIKKLADNNKNLDSLLNISLIGFQKMNDYLKKNKRGNISVLLLTGGWIEGLYIISKVYNQNPNEAIRERIAEQKISLKDINLLVKYYKSDPKFDEINKNLTELVTAFEPVTITYTEGERITKEVDGKLVVVDNTKTTVTISDDEMNNILATVEKVRNNMIQ